MNDPFEKSRENAMRAENLPALFEAWKAAHRAELSPENTTFPRCPCCGSSPDPEVFRDSFCKDGYFNPNRFNGVLVVCRESNVTGEIRKRQAVKDRFWLREEAEAGRRNRYLEYLEGVLPQMGYPEDSMKNSAWMNLNKRGGYGSCTAERLSNYVKRYQDFIRREIEIICPSAIACAGTFGHVRFIFRGGFSSLPDVQLYDVYHPASRRRNRIKGIDNREGVRIG